MRLRALLLAAFLSIGNSVAWATPQLYDTTDLWFDPNESGWGLNVMHQGDTLFASLFVYASNGRPRWYAASAMVGGDDGPLHDRPFIFTGALYESTGPSFGGAFNPNAVARRQVGTMTLEVLGVSSASLRYTIDGVNVDKHVRRFAFRPVDFSGTYVGYQNQPASSPGGAINDDMTITINQSGSAVSMSTQGSASGSCSYTGTYTPFGQLANIIGTYTCADGRSGNFSMLDVDAKHGGFTSRFSGNRIRETFFGRMVGSRVADRTDRGDGWRNSLWFDPNESGWGLNVIEQGDTLFGTLFVYDASGQPKWYSAPALVFSGRTGIDGTGRYTGTVYESTGPYYGGSFDPNAVTRRPAGTMTFEVYGNDTGYLDFSIDGVSVSHKPLRRFTFRANSLAGTYVGHRVNSGNQAAEPLSLNVTEDASAVTISTQGPASGDCTYRAPRAPNMQYGAILDLSGTFSCTNADGGNFEFYDLDSDFTGFTAVILRSGTFVGYLEGVRTGPH